jgi:hypothetical protein
MKNFLPSCPNHPYRKLYPFKKCPECDFKAPIPKFYYGIAGGVLLLVAFLIGVLINDPPPPQTPTWVLTQDARDTQVMQTIIAGGTMTFTPDGGRMPVTSTTQPAGNNDTPTPPKVSSPTSTIDVTPTIKPSSTTTTTPTLSGANRPPWKWLNEVADGTMKTGFFASLLVDQKGNPAIAYFMDDGDGVKVAIGDGLTWDIRLLRSQKDCDSCRPGFLTSMAADRKGKLYIAYWIYPTDSIAYIYGDPTTGVWVDKSGDAARKINIGDTNGIALAADPTSDSVIMAFLNHKDGHIYLYRLQQDSHPAISGNIIAFPNPQKLPEPTKYGINVALAVDAGGQPHLAFPTESNGLQYVAPGGKPITIDKTTVQFVSMTLGPSGGVYISYYDVNRKSLKLAYKEGNEFSVREIDTSNVGQYSSIKIDTTGNVHISYYDAGQSALKYAWLSKEDLNGTPVIQFVDKANAGQWSSLALDSNGMPRIAYYEIGQRKLKYTYALKP